MAKNNKRIKLLKLEKRLLRFTFFLILICPLISVFSKAALTGINIKVERTRQAIKTQTNRNQSLVMKVNELRSFENIRLAVEREGLVYNSSNIRVIAQD